MQRKMEAAKRTPLNCNLVEETESFLIERQRPSDEKPLASKTVRSYRQGLAAFQTALTEKNDDYEVKQAVRAIIDRKLASGEMSRSGMNVYIRALNSFFSWCRKVDHLLAPIRIPLLEVEKRKRPRTLSPSQVLQWRRFRCTNLTELRAKYMVLNILDTGLRAEESLDLQDGDLNWNGSRLWATCKGGGKREVPLSDEGQHGLRRYLALTSDCRETRDPKLRPFYSYVFCTEHGGKLNYRNALRDLKKIAKRLGMPWVGWHTFRRTFATQYIRRGGLLTDLQQILGHEDVRTTLLYLGDSIDEIVNHHNDYSPLAAPKKRGDARHPSSRPLTIALLSSGFRKR